MLAQIHSSPDLVEQVHEALLSAICSGELAPGERFTQEALASRLGVSRQPVLQALLLLRQQGLIRDTDNRRGVRVAELDADFARSLYVVRASLDGLAARGAAERARPELTDRGKRLINEARAASTAGDMNTLVRLDLAFHRFIYEASGNPVLLDTARLHWPHTRRVMAIYLRHPVPAEGIWNEHEAILDAIVAGDAATAERLSSEHARRSSDLLFGRGDAAPVKPSPRHSAQRRRTP